MWRNAHMCTRVTRLIECSFTKLSMWLGHFSSVYMTVGCLLNKDGKIGYKIGYSPCATQTYTTFNSVYWKNKSKAFHRSLIAFWLTILQEVHQTENVEDSHGIEKVLPPQFHQNLFMFISSLNFLNWLDSKQTLGPLESSSPALCIYRYKKLKKNECRGMVEIFFT